MEFNLKKSGIVEAVNAERFLLFKYSKALRDLFLTLFFLFLIFVLFSFLGLSSGGYALKACVFFFLCYLAFAHINLFLETKIRKIGHKGALPPADVDLSGANLADYLDFNATKIAQGAVKFCQRKKVALSATALFYGAVKFSPDVQLLLFRMGLNAKKMEGELKNCIEKMQRVAGAMELSEDFGQVLVYALQIANQRQKQAIGEKELLVALSKFEPFLKQAMMDSDLKYEDFEAITLWLDSAENSLERARSFWSAENLARQGSMGKDWASGYTITLDQYAIDWRRAVSKWLYREIIGHKKEIEKTEMILARSENSNALIIGEPGTGRKSIVEAIAQRCYLAESLPELNNKRVVELDMVALAATIQDFEQVETILDRIFAETVSAGNVILVIDGLQNFVGHSGQRAGTVDISGILSKYLSMPAFQFVGITTFDGLHSAIEQNSSFASLFQKVEVSEITIDETIRILQDYALEIEHKYKVLVLYPAIREIVNLTGRYMPSLPFPKKAIDILDQAAVYVQTLHEKIVAPSHIAKIISEKTEIPVGKMDAKEKETLLNLENLIHQRLVNQQEAVGEISVAMRRARAGIGSKKRPMGSFLFLGPTGVGKTETAKALAQIYFGSEDKMIRLDMSEFQAVADIPRLLGAVSPVEMQGLLTTPVRETPFSLVLCDEIEKAHPNILNLFLQILDEGQITDGQGRKVVFANTIIICTSNAGADMIFKEVEAGKDPQKDQLLAALFDRATFRPEFVNRFDATVIFHPLTKENLLQIAELSLKSLQKNLKEKEIDFEITEALKEKIVELSYKPAYGARQMRRVIQDNIENAIATALLADQIKKGDKISMDAQTFQIVKNT